MLFEIVNYSFPIILEYVTTSSCFPIDSLSFPYYLLNCSLLFPSCFPLISLLIPIISLFFSYFFSIVSPLFPLIYSYYIPIISLIVPRVSLAPAMQDHIWTSKRGPRPSVLNNVDWKRASPDSCVHVFDILTSRSGPMSFAPQPRALFQHVNFDKVFRKWCALPVLAWKCASRNNGVHFLNISTSKSAPNMRFF